MRKGTTGAPRAQKVQDKWEGRARGLESRPRRMSTCARPRMPCNTCACHAPPRNDCSSFSPQRSTHITNEPTEKLQTYRSKRVPKVIQTFPIMLMSRSNSSSCSYLDTALPIYNGPALVQQLLLEPPGTPRPLTRAAAATTAPQQPCRCRPDGSPLGQHR
jgi:hypothetical protein